MRPLDFLGRIKVKLGIVIVLAVGTAFVVNEVGINSGLSREVRIAVAVVLALIMVQVLAMGMTKPLRQMASAAQTIAKGRYSLRVSATSRDEVGELARAFNAMAADLGEVDRQRRELVANVSHELRTPITGLRAVLENVVDGVSAPDPVTMRTALAQTERLGRLVAQLLDLSRLDSGVRLMEPEAVELAPLIEQAVREAELAREDVVIRAVVAGDLVVRADPDLLAQVLSNLIDNAVRHSPPDGLVTVSGVADGAGVRIAVADRGPGIPVSARGRVFERFSRLDAGRAADSGGAGLGLAIVKEIVELHGGSIRIDDCAGCRMVVDLPGRTTMADAPLEAEQQRNAAEDARPEPAAVTAEEHVAAGAAGRVSSEVGAVHMEPASVGGGAVGEDAGAPAGAGAGVGVATAAGSTVEGSGAAPAVPMPAPPSVGSGWARMIGGGVLGVLVGFLTGMFAAVLVSVTVGDGMALVTLVMCTAFMGAVGVALGAGSGRRAAYQSAYHAAHLAQATSHAARGQVTGFGGGLAAGEPVGQAATQTAGQAVGQAAAPAAGLSVGQTVGQAGGQAGGRSAVQGGPVGAQARGQLVGQGGRQTVGQAGAQTGQPVGHGTEPYRGQAEPFRGQAGPPPYVPPPLFPKPELPEPPRWLLPAAAGAGVFAAVALPEAQVGLGIVLVAMVLGAAALPAVARRMTPWTVAFGATAYWLISMAAVRDADWLVAVLLMAGTGLGALAVSGAGAGWLGVIRGGASVLLALGPVPWFLAVPIKKLTARRRVMPMLAALSITAVLLLVFGLLFSSADAVFASYVERLTTTPDWAESAPLRIFLFAVFAVLLAAVVLVALRPVVDPVGPETKFTVSRSVWLVPLTAVNLLFASFVAVQITALFGGNTWVLKTAGLTYAEYARQGFFQLVVVSVFVLGIVAVAGGLLKTERRERWVLACLLGVLCGLTMVVLASALHRMNLYTDAYGLSRLRISVQATVWWLGTVFALVLLAGAARLAGRGSGWLPRTIVLVTGLGLGAFAVVNPDLQVAYTQVEVRGVTNMDSDYLGDLGAEAVPALDRLPEPQRSCVLADVVSANGLNRPDPWNGWNLARAQARDLLAERPIREAAPCHTV
jgi:signal transduction histidine kinase